VDPELSWLTLLHGVKPRTARLNMVHSIIYIVHEAGQLQDEYQEAVLSHTQRDSGSAINLRVMASKMSQPWCSDSRGHCPDCPTLKS